ncbi:ATP synthase subunit I [Clostridium sp.]|uniref:ATP synthase subunit I n=1 Tax=Clostridium sp. TaxID=1506 RepID=UPI001A43E29E|nr:ATP synthase subunit I [Clostridium sp.]MBK5235563.1 ATP synthase subunit I [Clostridium sp.]
MNNDFKIMFKKIVIYDFFISVIFTAMIYFIAKSYALFFLLGLIIALISFYINGITAEYSLNNKNGKSTMIMMVGLFIRIFLVSIIGFIVGRNNIFIIIAYIFGYSSQFISLVYYGLNSKNIQGK